MAISPYFVGQWVRAEYFYGRKRLIDNILNGQQSMIWLMGSRRIGKTSLLKQLEYLALTSPKIRFFPLFLDFQGVSELADIHDCLLDALFNYQEHCTHHDFTVDDCQGRDFFHALQRLLQKLRKASLTLLILCDEAEELIHPTDVKAELFRHFDEFLQTESHVRIILTSKFLPESSSAFTSIQSSVFRKALPPIYLSGLSNRAARALIGQTQLAVHARPELTDNVIARIQRLCNNHPFLLQLLSERFRLLQDIDRAIEDIARDHIVSNFFTLDYALLTTTDHEVLGAIHSLKHAYKQSLQENLFIHGHLLEESIDILKKLGFVDHDSESRFYLANYFFNRWFSRLGPPQDKANKQSRPGVSVSKRNKTRSRPDLVGTLLANRYNLMEQIGEGATAKIFKAQDTHGDKTVAVKLIKSEHIQNEGGLKRVRREVYLTRGLSHPNILNVYDLVDDDDFKFIVMQYIDGLSLASIIKNEAPLSLSRTVTIAIKVAGALEVAHDHSILHRDIKPQNILIDKQDEPFLMDFGLARLMGSPNITSAGTFLGTPEYASPEQIMGRPADARSDLYALGIVLYEMVTGFRPFFGNDVLTDILKKAPSDPRTRRNDIPEKLARIILRCLEKKQAFRFRNAKALKAALQKMDTS